MPASPFTLKTWPLLTRDEWYAISVLRLEVFVVEQNCPYQDMDGKDQKSLHLWQADAAGRVTAYLRIPAPGVSYAEPSIGRVAVANEVRGTGLGKVLMNEGLKAIALHYGPEASVRISAQQYLMRFYTELGFRTVGEPYLEDDIPHIEMLYTPAP